jgi:hypothetical protein
MLVILSRLKIYFIQNFSLSSNICRLWSSGLTQYSFAGGYQRSGGDTVWRRLVLYLEKEPEDRGDILDRNVGNHQQGHSRHFHCRESLKSRIKKFVHSSASYIWPQGHDKIAPNYSLSVTHAHAHTPARCRCGVLRYKPMPQKLNLTYTWYFGGCLTPQVAIFQWHTK